MAIDKNRTGHEDKSAVINVACWIPHMSVECQRKRVLEQLNVFVCWSFVVCAPFAEMIRTEESKAGGTWKKYIFSKGAGTQNTHLNEV